MPQDTEPVEPVKWDGFKYSENVSSGKTAIISPYAKSVASLPENLWTDIVEDLKQQGYELFTNVCGDEKPLQGTKPISPRIAEMKSAVERAGLFIGIRSGMCDVIKTADCRKIALYPDYYYCDTKWKSIDMYSIDGEYSVAIVQSFRNFRAPFPEVSAVDLAIPFFWSLSDCQGCKHRKGKPLTI